MTDTSERDEGYLPEVVRKSALGIVAFVSERLLLAGVAFAVTTVSGAAVYGFLSVFLRGETISRNLVAGLGDGYTRTLPRVSESAQRTLVSVGTLGFVFVWAVVATGVVAFRGPIVDATLLEPRHESVVAAFAVGLLPFLLLRNVRDVFRSLRRIGLAMLVSRIFTPLALLVGVVTTVAVVDDRSLFDLWVGVVVVTVGLTAAGAYLLISRTALTPGSLRAHPAVVGEFLRYSAGTTGVAVLELVQRRAVFVVMAVFLSPVAAGAFSLSLVLGLVVRWPLSGVNGIFPPIAAALYNDGQRRTLGRLYRQTSRLATVATTPVFVFGFAYAPDLLAVFNEAYVRQAAVLRLVLVAQYVATVFGSVGLLLLMTDNERASLLIQVLNASVALPLMIVLTVRFGAVGLGVAYLLSLVVNNTTELVLLYARDGFVPFSREQAYAVLSAVPLVSVATLSRSTPGTPAGVAAVLAAGAYVWVGWRLLLRPDDRAALGSLMS